VTRLGRAFPGLKTGLTGRRGAGATLAPVVTKTNRRSPRRAGVIVGLAVLGVAGMLLGAGCGDSGSSLPSGVVARVGDAPITTAELDKTIEQSRAQATAQGQTLPEAGQDGYDDLRRQALDSLVRQKVVELEAKDCGTPCKVTEADISNELARIKSVNFQNSQKKFDTFLQQRKISATDARDIVRSQLQQQKLYDHVTRGVRFTAADAQQYYDQNPSQFKVPAGRDVKHILVATKAEADRIRAEVTPENFAQLAKQNSIDTGSAKNGGDLGQAQPGQFVPEFDKVAFKLKNGEISQPVKTQFGWHIITVKLTPAKTTSFAQAKAQIIATQLDQKRQTVYNDWSSKVLKSWTGRTVYADSNLKPVTTTASTAATAPAQTTTAP
jgi:foldase protein PrsA